MNLAIKSSSSVRMTRALTRPASNEISGVRIPTNPLGGNGGGAAEAKAPVWRRCGFSHRPLLLGTAAGDGDDEPAALVNDRRHYASYPLAGDGAKLTSTRLRRFSECRPLSKDSDAVFQAFKAAGIGLGVKSYEPRGLLAESGLARRFSDDATPMARPPFLRCGPLVPRLKPFSYSISPRPLILPRHAADRGRGARWRAQPSL